MWLAQKMKPAVPEAEADQGVSTIVGDEMGVVTRGEVRRLRSTAPAGMCGCRRAGQACWSSRAVPAERSSASAADSRAAAPKGMQPGEVYLHAPGGVSVYLKRDGTLELRGRVDIRGSLSVNGESYKPCTCGEGEAL